MKNRFIVYILLLLFITPGIGYSQVQFRETVWLQLERELFLAGEEIDFRAVLLENDTYNPSVLSNSLRLELADSRGNKIKRLNLLLSGSEVSGIIDIPQNLETGWYFLRGYTNWMRNFDEDDFATHAIKIFNPNDKNGQTEQQRNLLNLEVTPYNDPVSGKRMCSVHATDKYGSGIEAHGLILSGHNDTVLFFKTDNTGWAGSYYNAGNTDRYQAFAENYPKDSVKFTISDLKNGNNQPDIIVTEKYGYINVSIQNGQDDTEYKLLIHRLYSWSWFNSGKTVNGQLSFRVPLKDIPAGISQMTILDEENNEIFRRLWSDYYEVLASVRIEAGNSNFNIREEQSFDFFAPFTAGDADGKLFSIIVHAACPGSGIYSYLPGLPGWPATPEIPASDEAFRAWLASNTYATGTGAAFFRNDPGYPAPPTFNKNGSSGIAYYPDTRPGIVRGRINDSQGNPLALKNVAMTILNDNSFSAARTDEQGFFALTFPDLHGNKDFFLNYYNEYDPSWKLYVEETFARFTDVPVRGRISFSAEEMEFLEKQNLLLQLKNIYYETDSTDIEQVDDAEPSEYSFYGQPDFSIEVDEYIKLPNLREDFLEIVPFVAVRQREGRNRLLLTGNNLLTSNFPALVLLDGIPLYEYDDLLNLPPDRVKRIEGINDFYVHGNIILSGIVNIVSKNNDFAGLKIPQTAVISSIHLPDTITGFNFNNYATKTGYPLIENVIVWDKLEPSSGNSVSIKLNDVPGNYLISIYGFDSGGRWYRGVKSFNVNDSL